VAVVNPETRLAGNAANRAAADRRARERLAAYDRGLRGAELAEALGVAHGSEREVLRRARRRLGVPNPRAPKPTCTYCGDVDHPGPC
jgi:hypothetical protein